MDRLETPKQSNGKYKRSQRPRHKMIGPEDIDQYYRDKYESKDQDWWRDDDGEDGHRWVYIPPTRFAKDAKMPYGMIVRHVGKPHSVIVSRIANPN